MKRKDLAAMLAGHRILWRDWKKQGALSIEDLQTEINQELAVMSIEKNILVRRVRVLGINIFYLPLRNQGLRLIRESRGHEPREQEFTLGQRIGVRDENHEHHKVLAQKCLKALGIPVPQELLLRNLGNRPLFVSPSYPGLATREVTHVFDVFLSKFTFELSGYVDRVSGDKFVWRPLEPVDASRPLQLFKAKTRPRTLLAAMLA